MADAPQKLTSISFSGVQVLALNDDGYPVGTAATEYAGLRILGAMALTLTFPEWETVPHPGDDKVMQTWSLPPTSGTTGELRVSSLDMTAEALVTGTNIITEAEKRMLLGNPGKTSYPEVCLVAWRRAKSGDTDTYGNAAYEGIIVPRATITPRGGSYDNRAIGERTFGITCHTTNKKPWGTQLTLATDGACTTDTISTSTEYIPRLSGFLADGVETEFAFGTAAQHADKVGIYHDDALVTTGTTVTVDEVTFDSAPAAGPVVAFIEIEESACS